jgi:hypothetical protein
MIFFIKKLQQANIVKKRNNTCLKASVITIRRMAMIGFAAETIVEKMRSQDE